MERGEMRTYRNVSDPDVAAEIEAQLQNSDIEVFVEQATSFDPAFARSEINNEYRIKIKRSDFEKADKILESQITDDTKSLSKDYYLLTFTDEELREVIEKQDEWSVYDYVMAQKLLAERGKSISPAELKRIKKERITELSKPADGSKWMIGIGYGTSVLGGFASIVIGWYLSFQKKTLPDGSKVYYFTPKSRMHGKIMFVVGIIVLVFWITFRFIYLSNVDPYDANHFKFIYR